MDSRHYISTMPNMDISAHESISGIEKSLLCRQQTTPERRFSISFDDFDADIDLDPEDDYFSQTYAPLSCLPTPPMSCATASPFTHALESAFGEDEDNDLLGPAIHMSNLVPTSASLLTPSPTLVQDILCRASLPSPVLELAVVIMDSLTTKFATNYRRQLPLNTPGHEVIDDVRPELIAMTSLLIANKFLDDDETRTRASQWQANVGMDLWTCHQINTCERLILECVGWNVMELAGEWLMTEARDDMIRAGRNVRRKMNKENKRPRLERTELAIDDVKNEIVMEAENKTDGQLEQGELYEIEEKECLSGSSDRSVQFMGQWTPVESPVASGRKVFK